MPKLYSSDVIDELIPTLDGYLSLPGDQQKCRAKLRKLTDSIKSSTTRDPIQQIREQWNRAAQNSTLPETL